jgi:hypothetical protein
MAKDPAFLFYPGDYLRDTQNFNENQQVSYDRIMCEHMRNICSVIGVSQAQLNFFTKRLTSEEKAELLFYLKQTNGVYQIEWVVESIEKRRAYSEGRRQNKTGNKSNICLSHDEHMENENENINNKEIIYTEDFLSFWKAYPNKSGSKKAAFDAWKKLGKSLPGMEEILSSVMIQKGWRKNANGEFRPEWKDPERWLKNRMWESDFKTETKKAIGVPREDFIKCTKCGTRTFKGDLNESGICIKCDV